MEGNSPKSGKSVKTQAKKLELENYQRRSKQQEKLIEEKIANLNSKITKNPEDPLLNYYHIMIAYYYVDLVKMKYTLYLTSVSLTGPGAQDEKILNDARGQFSNAVLSLEKVVGRYIDADLDEVQEAQESIQRFNPARILALYNHFTSTFENLEKCAKQRQTWYKRVRWNLEELEGRYCSAIKNMLDLREAYAAESKPYYPFGKELLTLFANITRKIEKCAENYRNKYNLLPDKVIEDLRVAILFMEALRKIYVHMNKSAEAEKTMEKRQIWERQMENDLKKTDGSKKKR
jgi:molybdenum-dependent DNA-binding transcriptional regulator ModE